MRRLVTFGCSNTIGEGLKDSPPMSEIKSQFAWPSLLAKKLDRELNNCGIAGASNLHILSEIMNYKFAVNDVIIVMWSFPQRDVVFSEDGKHARLGTWSATTPDIKDYAKSWIASSTEYDLNMRSWLAIHQAYELLSLLDLEFHFIDIQQDSGFLSKRPAWANEVIFMPFSGDKYFKTLPKADDNIHPGREWHYLMSEIIYMGVFDV